jgi:phage/plasmid-like protein (TIGR03299 family)
MAYVGEVPWHGLGVPLQPGRSIEEWQEAAGLNWTVAGCPAMYMDPQGQLRRYNDRQVLVREDTYDNLAMVSDQYKIVQPGEVLEFYRDLVADQGFELETAGSLKNGRRVWALARTGETAKIGRDDEVANYLLLATSYDGGMATVVQPTSVRVVCMNTLQAAVGASGEYAEIRVPHHSEFDGSAIKQQLGLHEGWANFVDEAKRLAGRKVSKEEALWYFLEVFYGEDAEGIDLEESPQIQRRLDQMLELYAHGTGQGTEAAAGTAWGLVNTVTRFYDHERNTATVDNRLNTSWFGEGLNKKRRGWEKALELVA